jgi:membrane protease YdiL (CAAX protease family)
MRRIILFGASACAGVLLCAFLAPVFYAWMPFFKFEKILNRLLMIAALVIAFSFFRMDRALFEACGMSWKKKILGLWLSGFALALAVLSLLGWVEYRLGAVTWSSEGLISLKGVGSALTTGVVVGLIEEFFFRGFLFLKLARRWRPVTALFLTNAIYSAVHFIRSGHPYVDSTPTFIDSLRVMGASFSAFVQFGEYWTGFVGLLFFGIVLSSSFMRTRSLLMPMALHAGAVFFLKLTRIHLAPVESASVFLYGGKGFYSGLLGWAFIGLIWIALRFFLPSSEKRA